MYYFDSFIFLWKHKSISISWIQRLNLGVTLVDVSTVQLKLNDVHIRYEDALTCAPGAFACGLTMESLAAESCDSGWRRGFTLLADTDHCSFKLLELQKLAVYWDPMTVPGEMLANCTISELTVGAFFKGFLFITLIKL